MSMPGVVLGKGHMCQHGMVLNTPLGQKLALKATGWLSNSKHIINTLARTCTNDGGSHDHDHADLQHSNAARAAVWPDKLCYAILKGIRKQLLSDNVMFEGEIGSISEDPVEKQFSQSLGDCYYDGDFPVKSRDRTLCRERERLRA